MPQSLAVTTKAGRKGRGKDAHIASHVKKGKTKKKKKEGKGVVRANRKPANSQNIGQPMVSAARLGEGKREGGGQEVVS